MNIDLLGYNGSETRLIGHLSDLGHRIHQTSDPVDNLSNCDVVISFGYRHILQQPVLDTAKRPPLNLHIGYLPFNRGAHPVFWALYDKTPLGVTIHEIDAGIDTGPIVAQREVKLTGAQGTFRSAHIYMIAAMEALFMDNLEMLLSGNYTATPQDPSKGTLHRTRDLPASVEWSMAWYATVARLHREQDALAEGQITGQAMDRTDADIASRH